MTTYREMRAGINELAAARKEIQVFYEDMLALTKGLSFEASQPFHVHMTGEDRFIRGSIWKSGLNMDISRWEDDCQQRYGILELPDDCVLEVRDKIEEMFAAIRDRFPSIVPQTEFYAALVAVPAACE